MHIYISGSAFEDNHEMSNLSHIDYETEFPNSTTPSSLRGQYEGKRVIGFRAEIFEGTSASHR